MKTKNEWWDRRLWVNRYKMETPHNHKFDVEFTCNNCREVQHHEGTLEVLLSDLYTSGWPICPECGDDMEHNVCNKRRENS